MRLFDGFSSFLNAAILIAERLSRVGARPAIVLALVSYLGGRHPAVFNRFQNWSSRFAGG
jgi:hypothetical protein